MASPGQSWHQVKRVEMKAWDDEMADVAMEATGYGWEGRFSSRGHLIMRAPDGRHTMSISKNALGRALQNSRAELDRWLRAQPGSSFGQAAARAAAGVEDLFGVEEGAERAVMPTDLVKYMSERGHLATHIQRLIEGEGLTMPQVKERVTLATMEAPSTLTVDSQWVVLDRVTHRALEWGSTMTEADAYALVYSPDEDEDEMTDETTSEPQPEAVETGSDKMAKAYRCVECGETFSTPHGLAAHGKIHVPERECVLCGARVKYLDTHLQRMHGASQESAERSAGSSTVKQTLVAISQDDLEDATKAVRRLLEAASLGIDSDRINARLREQNAALEAENARLKGANEELQTKIDVIKEGLGL